MSSIDVSRPLLALVVVLAYSFSSAQPPQTGNGDLTFAVCADILLIIDVSCSVSDASREQAVNHALAVINQLNTATVNEELTIRVAAEVYDKYFYHRFDFGDNLSKNSIMAAIANIDLQPEEDCRTHTNQPLKQAWEHYFTQGFGDRNDLGYKNIVLLYTDQRSYPAKRIEQKAIDEAETLKNNGVHISVIHMPNEFNNSPPLERESKLVPSDPYQDNTYEVFDEEGIDELAEQIANNFKCPAIFFTETICADIVFVFDISCSIEDADKQAAKDVAISIVDSLAGDIQYGAFTFDKDPYDAFSLSTHGINADAVTGALEAIDMKPVECNTFTYAALNHAGSHHFSNDGNNDRADDKYPDVIILFNDGLTAPFNKRDETINTAKRLHSGDLSNVIDIYMVKLENNREKDGSEEFNGIGSYPENIVPSDGFLKPDNVQGVVNELMGQLMKYQCP